jgi:hypothetical protein
MALPCSYGGSDSRPPFTHAEGDPRFTSPECVLSFCVQPPRAFLCPRITLVVFRVLGTLTVGPFPVCAHRFSRLRHCLAGSPRHKAESTFSRTDRQTRLPLLSTPPSGDAVTFGFQPVECLVESISTSSSGALSGALGPVFRPGTVMCPTMRARNAGDREGLCCRPLRELAGGCPYPA